MKQNFSLTNVTRALRSMRNQTHNFSPLSTANRSLPHSMLKRTSKVLLMLLVLTGFSNLSFAQCNLLNEAFNSNPTLSNSNVDGAWYPDRYRPASFTSAVLGSDNVLKISIDGTNDAAAARPSGYGSSFYNTQGRKFNQCGTCVTVLKGDLWLPSSWATSLRRTDMWATAFDNSNSVSGYPIIGFRNVDGSTPGIYYWDFDLGFVNSGVTLSYDAWYNLEFRIAGSNLEYLVNNSVVATVNAYGSTYFGNIIMQAYNFNDNSLPIANRSTDSYDAYWDNLVTTGTGGNVVMNTNTGETFCTIQAAIDDAETINGHTITVSAGSYTEAITVSKALTINGANLGIAGNGSRLTESVLENCSVNVSSTGVVVIDGFYLHQTNNTTDVILLSGSSQSTVQNCIFRRDGITTGNVVRAITTSAGSGAKVIQNNKFTGDISGGLFSGHKTWNNGLYINGASSTVSILNNYFEICRTAVSLDDFNSNISVSGNEFDNCGTFLSFGGTSATNGQYTLGSNNFKTPGSAFINLSNVNVAFRLNITSSKYNGALFSTYSLATLFAIENGMYHRGLASRNGLIYYVANNQYVTGLTPIQNAINYATAGDIINVKSGNYNEDLSITTQVTLLGEGYASTTITGPKGGGGNTMQVSAAGVIIDGFKITRAGNNLADWDNANGVLNTAGIAIQSSPNSAEIKNCLITGLRTGIDINNASGSSIHNNIIDNNRTGLIFRNTTNNINMQENFITNNWTVGVLFLDASSGSNSPAQSASSSTFNNNDISGNWYGEVVDRQTGGSLPAPGSNLKNFNCNWFGASSTPTSSNANSSEPGYSSLIPVIFGGSSTPPAPGTYPDILGTASANIDVTTWIINGTDNSGSTIGFQPAQFACNSCGAGAPVGANVISGNQTISTQTQMDAFFSTVAGPNYGNKWTKVTGNLVIDGSNYTNPITNLCNVMSLTEVTGTVTIVNFFRNGNPNNLNGLAALKTIGCNLNVSSNPKLITITLDNLETTGCSFYIKDNANAKTISAPYLKSVQGDRIDIQNNPKTEAISLSANAASFNFIGKGSNVYLSNNGNTASGNLSMDMNKITKVNGVLMFNNNDNAGVSNFDNIFSALTTVSSNWANLTITNNDYLAKCCIAASATVAFGNRTISNNTGNCASIAAVISDCGPLNKKSTVMQAPLNYVNLSIFPNPNKGTFSIQINSVETGYAQISILDLMGRTVFSESRTLNGNLTLPVSLETYAAGQYVVKANINGQQYIQRLMLTK